MAQDDYPSRDDSISYLKAIAQEDVRALSSKVHPVVGNKQSPSTVVYQQTATTTMTEEDVCQHSNVSYCVGQTDLKGEDVVFLEHRRPWPGRSDESFCSSKKQGGGTTFHECCCSECGFNISEYSLFCVFDGHNGRHAAKHSADSVRETLEKHLPRGNVPPVSHPDYEEWRSLLQRALAITLVELNGTFAAKGVHAGCTATIVLITEWLVTCINVGDSHAYLDTGSQLIQLTCDHRVASNKLDRRRVELTGAIVAPVSISGSGPADAYSPGLGPMRVWPGGLCISRAIGDFDVGPSIVPYGYITQTLIPSKGGRILIGSDGVWDAFHKRKKVGAMTRSWPLDTVPSKIISTIVRMHGMVKDDTSLIVVDVLPTGVPVTFPEMVAASKKEGSAVSLRSFKPSSGGDNGGLFCSCFGGKPNGASVTGGSVHGRRSYVDDSARGSTIYDDSVRSGVSMKSLSSMNSRGWIGCVIDEVDIADLLDLMPTASQALGQSQEGEEFLTAKPEWLVEELKDALLSAAMFATESWLEASGRLPPKPMSDVEARRPSKVSFADQVSVEPARPDEPSELPSFNRQSSEFFRDAVLHASDSVEFGSKFGHYSAQPLPGRDQSLKLTDHPKHGPAEAEANVPSTSFLASIPSAVASAITDMSVRAGRVYNSEASVRAGAQFKSLKLVQDPSVRLRGSNLEGSVHHKAYEVEGASFTPDSSTDGRKIDEETKGVLKTRTVQRRAA